MELFGWLTPQGNFYQTGKYTHIKAVGEHPELKALVPSYDQKVDTMDQIKQGSLELIEQGEHPEWHRYEMYESDFESTIVRTLFKVGCLRVGTVRDYLHFEGFPPAIERLHQKAKNLAEENGMGTTFEPRSR